LSSPSILQSLLHLGIVTILDAEVEPQPDLPELLDASSVSPAAFLAELRERGILPAPKGAQQ
jgi:hypothetical protein